MVRRSKNCSSGTINEPFLRFCRANRYNIWHDRAYDKVTCPHSPEFGELLLLTQHHAVVSKAIVHMKFLASIISTKFDCCIVPFVHVCILDHLYVLYFAIFIISVLYDIDFVNI